MPLTLTKPFRGTVEGDGTGETPFSAFGKVNATFDAIKVLADANEAAVHAAVTVTDSFEIDFTLTGQDLTATLKAGSIDETKLDTSVNASLDLADSAIQQAALDAAVAGLYDHKGAYDASTNTPDLDTTPSGIKKADAYTVSVAGTFFAVALEAGDVLIADQDDPTLSTHWTIVNRNIDSSAFASAAHTIASHSDTTATGAELETLTDNSIADTLHRHSELVAPDGSPDPAVSVDAAGNATFAGTISVDDTTDSTSTTTGSIHTDGGLGVAKKSFLGDDVNLVGGLLLKPVAFASNQDGGITLQNTANGWVTGLFLRSNAGGLPRLAIDAPSGAESLSINTGGDVTVSTGNLIISTAGKGIDYNGGPKDLFGTGTPEGAITAAIGSTYRRADGGAGTSFYIKESGTGNTGWRAV